MMKNEKGVALATLVIAIIVMLTITGTITYKSLDSIKLRRLDDMYNDIRLLNQKITSYYIENDDIPVLEGVTILKTDPNLPEPIKNNNVNDSINYYIIDLEKLGGISLKYGKEYKEYAADNTKQDIYIINEKTHTVYYLNGLEVKAEGIDVTKYAIKESYEEIVLPTPMATPMPTPTATPEEIDILPSEYQEVEYIRNSTRTEYIDTGVSPSANTQLEIDMQIEEYISNNANLVFIFGCRNSTSNLYGRFEYHVNSSLNNTLNLGYDTTQAGRTVVTDVKQDFKRHIYLFDSNEGTAYMDNQLMCYYTNTSAYKETWVESPDPLYLFKSSYDNNNIYTTYTKIYKCKITKDGILVRDFIPCYRKNDNVDGLYDLVNGVFYQKY
ncbi:MAG: hypothetical protein IKT41_00830 [Clostridia bacterium]|nr:hypothetical protein [Clostridia bacterium]